MKNLIVVLVLFFSFFFLVPVDKTEAYSRVKGYFKKSGTYIQPHFRSNSNSFKWDNYSSKGNINPWNGKSGSKNWY